MLLDDVLIRCEVNIMLTNRRSKSIQAWKLPNVEGLVIHRDMNKTGWTITHCRSGTWVCRSLATIEQAIIAVYMLCDIADWNKSVQELLQDQGLKAKCDRIVKIVNGPAN